MYHIRPLRKLKSLLVFTFLVGSLGIVTAIGIPVFLLINRQASSQTDLLLNQALLTTQAALAREQSDLQNLALLISQRPTLTRLLEDQDLTALASYLDTLRTSANLDVLIVCNANQEVIGLAKDDSMTELCSANSSSGIASLSSGQDSLMYTSANLQGMQGSAYKVVVGKRSSSVLARLQQETGLIYFLVWQNRLVASSDPLKELSAEEASALTEKVNPSPGSSDEKQSLNLKGNRYILSNLVLNPNTGLNLIGALNVDGQVAIQQSLSRTLVLGLIAIVLLASGLGIWLSQKLSYSFSHLANAASEFRQGNLDTPVAVQSSVWEISQLANTLEDARVALQHSLEQLQAEKAWIEHVLNSIIEGMVTLDHQNQITFASAGMAKIAGYAPDLMIGQRIDEIFLPVDGEIPFADQLPVAGQQRRISVKLKNGQERLLSISMAKLVPPEARSSNRALVIRDVSNDEYLHRLLGDFMANITHEFRTPLAALEASSELLLDNLHSLSKTELEDLLVALNLGIINLQTLIDNLIEGASIEAGRFRVALQPVAFDSILKDALKVVQPLAEKYTLRLVSSPSGEALLVMADQRRTVQALVNLLSNAIKHSPENGQIQINSFVEEKYLKVEVTDEGEGIPLDLHNNLFRRFGYLDSPNERAKQGVGLGLSVVKEIVEAQQGSVGITDQVERGTTFWFTLPLASEQAE